jgi:hypothetical protein
MTKKIEEAKVNAPVYTESIPLMNVSAKLQPSEYLERATSMLAQHGALTIAGLGNAATQAIRTALLLEKFGFKVGPIGIAEKMMTPQKWEPDTVDPKRGKWVDDPLRKDLRPVAQIMIRLEKK